MPTPNHCHVVANDRAKTEKATWWEVEPLLIGDPADWPNQAGNFGITSVWKPRQVEKRGQPIEMPSNFYLFFSSEPMGGMQDQPAS